MSALSIRYDEYNKRLDYRNGILCSVIANVHRKKGSKEYKPTDFMPKYSRRVKKISSEELLNRVRYINNIYNGINNGNSN